MPDADAPSNGASSHVASSHVASSQLEDPARLRALARYDILDSAPEETFDRVSDLAAAVFEAPIGLVTFLDDERQWHKACVGLEVPELDLDTSFCVHTLDDARRLVVEDATEDERFEGNPLVTGEQHVRFYAGAPLVTPDGHMLGTVCVLDTEPRSPTEQQLAALDDLAQMTVDALERRRRQKIQATTAREAGGGALHTDVSDARLNELLAALDEAVWEVRVAPEHPSAAHSIRTELLYTNGAEEAVFGRPTEALVEDPMLWRSVAHPEDQDALPSTDALLASGTWRGEYRLLRPDGTARWVETTIQAVGSASASPHAPQEKGDEDAPEAPVKLAGVTRDIHRRKQAEATAEAKSDALASEKSRLQMALDAADSGVFEWHIPTDERRWDDRVRALFGVDAPPATTGALLEHVHPEDRSRLQSTIGQALGDAEMRDYEASFRISRRDAPDRHVEARGLIERGPDGEALRTMGVYRDSTDREERRRELRRRKRQFDAVVEDPNMLVGVLAPDGRLLNVNDTALSYIEEERADVLGEPFWETPWWHHDAQLQADLQGWIERAAAGEYVSYEAEQMGGGRTSFVVRGSIRPVTNGDGEVTSLVISGRDVTTERDRQRELEILHQAVEDAADGVAVLVGDEFVYVDQTHADMYGFDDREQLLGNTWRMLYADGEVERIEQTVFPILEEKGHWQGFVTGQRPDGSSFPAELSLTLTDAGRLVCTVRDMTDRRRRDRRRQLVLVASETGIAEWDTSSGRVEWDGMLREAFGQAPETLEEFLGLVDAADRMRVVENLESVVENGASWSGEFRIADSEGRTRWLSTLVIPVFDGGDVARVLATGTDITERKRRERSLESSRERYQTLLEAAPDPVFVADAQTGKILEANAAAESLLGQDRDTIVGLHQTDLHPRGRADAYEALFQRSLEEEEILQALPDGTQIEIVTGEGERVPVEINATTVELPGGPVVYGIFRDVSERKAMQKEIVQRERRFQMMFEHHSAPMLLIDEDTGAIENANAAAVEFYGYGRDALTNMAIQEINQLPDDAVAQKRGAAAEAETDEFVFEHELASGEVRTVNVLSAPIPGLDQQGTLLFSVIHDVTERKERKEELRQQSTMLEQVLNSIGDIFYMVDEEGALLLWNDRLGEVTGYSDAQIESMCALDFFGDDAKAHVRRAIEEAIETGHSQVEAHLQTQDAQAVPYEFSGRAFEAPGHGRVLCGIARDVSNRKRRERLLQRANRRFEQFAEAAPNAFFVLAPDYSDVFFLNSAAERLYGVPEAELREDPRTWTRHVHPVDLPALQADMDAQATGKADWPHRQEFRVLHPTRGRRWIAVEMYRIEGAADAPRIAGVATDITERKVREQRLQVLYRITQDLLEVSSEAGAASIVAQALGESLSLEEAAVYRRDEGAMVRVGAHSGDTVPEMPRVEAGHTPLWTALEAGERQVFDDPSTIDDSVDRSGLERCAYFPLGPHGTLVVGTCASSRLDEAELRFVELVARALQKALDTLAHRRNLTVSERRYRVLAENIPNGAVLLFDEALRYTLAAGTLLDEYEVGEPDFLGERVGTVLGGEMEASQAALAEHCQKALRGEHVDRRVEFGERVLRIHAVALQEQDQPGGLLLAQDVTTEAARERKLLEAKEAAEEANQMKTALLSNMSHEFRTPLTGVLGFAGLIREDSEGEDETTRHYATQIEQSGARLLNTLNDVLDLAQLEGGEKRAGQGTADVVAAVADVLDTAEQKAREKDIDLHVETEEESLWADAGSEGLKMISRQLIENAIKYTEDGGTVRVREYREDGWATIEVEDSGVGIDPEKVDELFRPFRQESEGFNREYEGAGLGLTIVKQALDQMDGAIEVETEKGVGSRFTVWVPQAKSETGEQGEPGEQ